MKTIFVFFSLVLLFFSCSDSSTINENEFFKVEINNLNEELGKTTEGSLYLKGTTCTLIAQSNIGCSFLGWYNGDQLIANTPQYSITPTSDISLTAKFITNNPGEYVYYYNNSLRTIYYNTTYEIGRDITFKVVELNDVQAVPFVLYDASNTSTPIAYTKTGEKEFTYTIPAKTSAQNVIIVGAIPLFSFQIAS